MIWSYLVTIGVGGRDVRLVRMVRMVRLQNLWESLVFAGSEKWA